MLRMSAESWNRGDLEGFLDDYLPSDELTFSGGTGVTRGWEDVRLRYLQGYWSPGAERDSLRFEDLEVKGLGEDHALVLGRYVLFRPEAGDSITGTGFFSLVLRRIDDGWKIIHDHTSASSPAEGEDR
jgi:beta-aspartyl-peptidase (threonine type)